MEGSALDEEGLFAAIARAGVRSLLIGRRALVVLGLPELTADYDLWIHIDDAEILNRLAAPFGLTPTREPEQARRIERYSLDNDEIVDVLVARSVPTVDGRKDWFCRRYPTPADRLAYISRAYKRWTERFR